MELTQTQIKLLRHYVKGHSRPYDATPEDLQQLVGYGLVRESEPVSHKEQHSGYRTQEPTAIRYEATEKGIEWLKRIDGEG